MAGMSRREWLKGAAAVLAVAAERLGSAWPQAGLELPQARPAWASGISPARRLRR